MDIETFEEKWAAVLDECKRLCPNKGAINFDWGYLVNWEPSWGTYWTAHNPTGECLFTTLPPKEDNAKQFSNYPLAHAILGLQVRETEAAYLGFKSQYESKMEQLCREVDAERAKVAALTEEKDHWQHDCGRYIERLSDEESKNHHLKIQVKEIKAANERHLTEIGELWRRKLEAEQEKVKELEIKLERTARCLDTSIATCADHIEDLQAERERVSELEAILKLWREGGPETYEKGTFPNFVPYEDYQREVGQKRIANAFLAASESKSAKFVEVAELVVRRNWERINRGATEAELSAAIGGLSEAIEAHKKGGSNV